MTRDNDIDRVLDRWFSEGPTQMPGRFLDDTLERIDRVPRHRVARLQTRLLAMYPNLRFAVAAAVIVAVAGVGAVALTRTAGVGVPPAASGLLPASLQAEWQSVGTRVVPGPGPGGINTYPLGILIDPTKIDIQNAHTDVINSARLVAPDRIEIRAVTMGDFWHCAVGNVGLYTFSLSSAAPELILSPVADACIDRATVLSGAWSRTDLGDLQPGRRDAAVFRPFGAGSSGRLTYTVPAGWAGTGMHDTAFVLARPSVSDRAAVLVLGNVFPSAQDAACDENRAALGVGRTPGVIAAWLKTVPGLVVSTPTEVTIGGLRGVMVELSVAPGRTSTCPSNPVYTLTYSGSDNGGWSGRLALNGSDMARYFLLDPGDGSTVVVAVEANQPAWSAFIADAMPVVDSFEFTR